MSQPVPCPYCGSSDVSIRSYQSQNRVGCNNCQSLGPVDKNPDLAVVAWNRSAERKQQSVRPGPSEFKTPEFLD